MIEEIKMTRALVNATSDFSKTAVLLQKEIEAVADGLASDRTNIERYAHQLDCMAKLLEMRCEVHAVLQDLSVTPAGGDSVYNEMVRQSNLYKPLAAVFAAFVDDKESVIACLKENGRLDADKTRALLRSRRYDHSSDICLEDYIEDINDDVLLANDYSHGAIITRLGVGGPVHDDNGIVPESAFDTPTEPVSGTRVAVSTEPHPL